MASSAYPVPQREEERLAAVRRYDLDAASDRVLETLCRLASKICKAEWSGVSIVHEDELTFAAGNGFEKEGMAREHAPCAHTVCHPGEVTVVEDASEDVRTRDNPYVTGEPGVRFYGGAPITSPDGHAVGTIWGMSTTPKTLSEDQRAALGMLADLAMERLDRHRRAEPREPMDVAYEPPGGPTAQLGEFAGVISHELRSVLTHVVSNLDLLDEEIGDELEDEPRELLDDARAGGQRLAELTQDLLRFAQTGDGDLTMEAVSVDRVLDDLADELAPEIEAAGASFEAGAMPAVDGQPGLVRLLFKNLLLNAIQYRGSEPPKVEITAEPAGDGMVRFEVSDNGIGVPEDEQDQLFEMFFRASNAENREGTGIGLALAQRIVGAHGGEIGVESTPGEGSTFWFTLPAG